jgi:hypothetical protein
MIAENRYGFRQAGTALCPSETRLVQSLQRHSLKDVFIPEDQDTLTSERAQPVDVDYFSHEFFSP